MYLQILSVISFFLLLLLQPRPLLRFSPAALRTYVDDHDSLPLTPVVDHIDRRRAFFLSWPTNLTCFANTTSNNLHSTFYELRHWPTLCFPSNQFTHIVLRPSSASSNFFGLRPARFRGFFGKSLRIIALLSFSDNILIVSVLFWTLRTFFWVKFR